VAMSNMVSPTPRKRSANERMVGSDIRVVSTLKSARVDENRRHSH
jgi:hypothetical protein